LMSLLCTGNVLPAAEFTCGERFHLESV
jgi:hypothetical protein